MLDLVPLTRARGKVPDMDRHLQFIGKLLQGNFPQPGATPIAAPTICGNQQFLGMRVALLAHVEPPPPDRLHRELGRIVINPHIHPALIGCQIIHPIGNDFSQVGIGKVMHVHLLWPAFGLPFPPGILKVAEQFLLFGISRDNGLFSALKLLDTRLDILELGIPIGMRAARARFAIGLETIVLLMEERPITTLTKRMSGFPQLLGQARGTLTGPAQRGLRISARGRLYQLIQGIPQRRIFLREFLAPATKATNSLRLQFCPSRLYFRQPRMNSPASNPQGFGHKADSPIAEGLGFRGGPAPPRPFVEQWGQGNIFVSNERHLFFPRHAASLPAADRLFNLFLLRALPSLVTPVNVSYALTMPVVSLNTRHDGWRKPKLIEAMPSAAPAKNVANCVLLSNR